MVLYFCLLLGDCETLARNQRSILVDQDRWFFPCSFSEVIVGVSEKGVEDLEVLLK